MEERSVIGLTGYLGTGKTTLAHYLAKQHSFYEFEGSTWLRQAAEQVGITLVTRADYDRVLRAGQQLYGLTWIADSMLARPESRLVHAGLRNKHDLLRIRAVGGIVIALSCPAGVCFARMDHNDTKNPKSLRQYFEHRMIEESTDEYGSHTTWSINHADHTLDTSRPISETYIELDSIVASMTSQE